MGNATTLSVVWSLAVTAPRIRPPSGDGLDVRESEVLLNDLTGDDFAWLILV